MERNSEDRARRAEEMCAAALWPEVLAFAQHWHEEDSRNHRAFYYIGLGLRGMGQPAQAETAFRRALAMDPTDFEIWEQLAELLSKNLRRPAEGVRCLRRALKINPRHKLGWLQLAALADDMGSHLKALECAEQAIALDPKLVEAYLRKAAAARALGRLDLVKDACRRLAAIEPEYFRRPS